MAFLCCCGIVTHPTNEMRLHERKTNFNKIYSNMIIWKATIKERDWESLLTPIYAVPEDGMHDHIDENFLIDFWGLNEPDVEWYKLEKIHKDGTTIR